MAKVTLAANLQTVQGLNQLSQTIIQNADARHRRPCDRGKSAYGHVQRESDDRGRPGRLHFGDDYRRTGYGLLLVTGNFDYASGANWNGIVLVIGKGRVKANGSAGAFNGAVLIAQTLDSSGNPLPGPNPGPASFNDNLSGFVGRGFIYNCGWINSGRKRR